MIHLYCGGGKGKTTAAMGLALRAAGRGKKVLVAQFLKSSQSGERFALAKLENVTLLPLPDKVKFTFCMDETDREEAKNRFAKAMDDCEAALYAGRAEVVILDEVCAAVNAGLLAPERVSALLDQYGKSVEIVMTGRDPVEELTSRADYITEMNALRHPYERGIGAREGVEF